MKKTTYLLSLFAVALFLFSACGNNTSDKKEIEVSVSENFDEFSTLVKFMQNAGDFINSKPAPTLIATEDVYENLTDYLVLDLRKEADYIAGHIDGAYNVPLGNLLTFMETEQNAGNYKKVVLVCASGQTAAYGTAILRFLGYGNSYSMKWGMTSWNPKFRKWQDKVSNKLASKLDYDMNDKAKRSQTPKLSTGETEAYRILKNRAQTLLADGFKPALITADKVMENPEDFYIINYWKEDHYNMGHLPGAVQYTPKKSLILRADLKTIPADKKTVLYCYTGQHSAFATAYLRLLGYNVQSLAYGANSFMNGVMKSPDLGHAFSTKAVKNYEFTEGENPSKVVAGSAGNVAKKATRKKVVMKKKAVQEEGGC